MRPRAAFFLDKPHFEGSSLGRVYGGGRRERVAERCDVLPDVITQENMAEHAQELADVRVLFTTWGMPPLTAEQLGLLPSLEICFYAAGSVQYFAKPLLERGVTVVSAWAANAVPVAEFCLAQVLLATKRCWNHALALHGEHAGPRNWRKGPWVHGAYGATVGIVSLGMIGRRLTELLQPFELELLGYDPFVDDDTLRAMGVEPCGLEDLFRRSLVVSLHTPNLSSTRGMIDGRLLELMPEGGTFINTARGAVVNEAQLIDVMRRRSDLTAILDVTEPEPPEQGSPLYTLPNVLLTPHLAGSAGGEVRRMADFMIDEYDAWAAGRPLRYTVSLEQLETMA